MSHELEFARLEGDLSGLASAVAFPPTPDLAAGFWRRLDAERFRQTPASPLSLAGLAVAAAVVAGAVLVGTVSPARDAAADLFDKVNIFETTESLEGLPSAITGEEVSLQEAEFALSRRIAIPDGFERGEVILQEFGGIKAAAISLQDSQTGAELMYIVTNTRIGKGLPKDSPDAEAEPVRGVGDGEAYWLTGERIVQYYDFDGREIVESQRLTDAPALIWQRDGYVYKIEGELEKTEATRIAKALAVP